MKRILFVDDEPDVLSGLRRSLRKQNLPWNITYVNSAKEALECMSKQAFDVIVTDILMPEMNGKELLDLVSQRHPGIVQIVLSGVEKLPERTHQDLGLQVLEKPCSLNKLVTTIERGLFMKELFQLNFLSQLGESFKDYSTFPDMQVRIQSDKKSDGGSLKASAEIICSDLGVRFRIPLNTVDLISELV